MFTKALYYPYIEIPDNSWIRHALLYWDEINPIVPRDFDERIPADHFSRLLVDEKLSEWKRPDDVFKKPDYVQFMDELVTRLEREQVAASGERLYDTRIYKDKIVDDIADRLRELGLIEGYADAEGWLHFETKAGQLYMGYLAAALAKSDNLEPLTDRAEYVNALLSSQLEPDGQEQIFARFIVENLIPTPRAGTGIPEIISFRQNHEEELLRFRGALRAVFTSVQKAEDGRSLARELEAVKDTVREQSLALARRLREGRIETVYSSIEASIPAARFAAALAGIPVIGVPLGTVVGGVAAFFKGGREVLNGRIRRNSLFADSDYAYVYRIEHELGS